MNKEKKTEFVPDYSEDDVYYRQLSNEYKRRTRVKKLMITAGCIATMGAAFALETVEVEALKEVTVEVKHEVVVGADNTNIHSYIVPEGYELKFVNNEPIGYKYEMGTYTLGDYLVDGISLKKTK